MESLLAAIDTQCATREASRKWAVLYGVAAVLLAAAGVAASVLAPGVPFLAILLGSLAGASLFFALYVGVTRLLSPERHDRVNFRQNLTLPRRRLISVWLIIGWVLLILLAFRPNAEAGVLVGAVNVTFLMFVWRFGSATPQERAEQYELFEAEEAAREAEQWADDIEDDWPEDLNEEQR